MIIQIIYHHLEIYLSKRKGLYKGMVKFQQLGVKQSPIELTIKIHPIEQLIQMAQILQDGMVINMEIRLPEKSVLPNGFRYPESLFKVVRLNLINLYLCQ